MPGKNQLDITIGGKVDPSLVVSTTQAGGALEGVTKAAQQTSAAITKVAAAVVPADKNLSSLANDAQGATNALKTVSPASASLSKTLDNVSASASKATSSLSKVSPGAGQAGAALTNVGRVAQDLPFGFIGIQNNLNPLLESFQRLRAETGSNGAALKAFGQSLIGAGGIGLALSLVSSAIVIYQNGIAGFNSKTKEATDKAKEFADSLKSVADIAGAAEGGVQGQISQVRALADVVTDANKSYQERSRALQELKEINKSYFGDLKLEESQMATLAARVNEYTKAIVQEAVVKGFADEISRVSVELAKQDKALKSSQDNLNRLRTALANTKQSETSLTGEDRVGTKYIKAKDAVEDAEKAFREQRDVVEKLATNYAELNGAIDGAVAKTLTLRNLTTSGKEANDKEVDSIKRRIDALKELRASVGLDLGQREELVRLQIQLARRDGVKLGFTPAEVEEQVQNIIDDEFQSQIKPIKVPIPLQVIPTSGIDVAGATTPNGIASSAFDGVVNAIRQNSIDKQEAIRKEIADSIRNSVLRGFEDGLFAVGDSIGNIFGSIITGNGFGSALAAAAQGLLGVVGGVLQEIGKQIIATSVLVQALKKALSSLFANPAAALGVGVGLVALGGLLKSIKFNVPGFADGVNNFSGGLALVGERGPELVRLPGGSDVIPNDQLGRSGGRVEVVGVIRGEDIYLSNNRIAKRRRRI